MTDSRSRTKCGAALALALGLAVCARAQVVEFKLDGSPEGRVGGRKMSARLGPKAKYVKSVEGRGVEPTVQAPAVIVPVPDDLWKPSGALAFRFRPSRTVRLHDRPFPSVVLANCPVFQLVVQEHRKHARLAVTAFHGGAKPKTKTERRQIAWATRGALNWSHLKAGQWYHLVFTWHAAKGRMDVYLNGEIQQELRLRRRWPPWTPPAKPKGELELGGVMGQGPAAARFAVDSVQLFEDFMDEKGVAAILKGRPNFALAGEGRWDLPGSIDLKRYKLTPVYEADFTKPLNWIDEEDLFDGDKRVRLPKGKDWVLENYQRRCVAYTEKGRCVVRAKDKKQLSHMVLWNTREFPKDFLLEFGFSPKDSRVGLTIIFFATRNLKGGSPFDLWVKKRAGSFRTYHSGELNGYHTSYWACNPFDGGILRRSANLRKNMGFAMPAAGIDRIGGMGPGPHHVRLLKVGSRIRLETRGRMALSFDDDGKTYGKAWTHPGWIGLRAMAHSVQVAYTSFKVWKVEPKP